MRILSARRRRWRECCNIGRSNRRLDLGRVEGLRKHFGRVEPKKIVGKSRIWGFCSGLVRILGRRMVSDWRFANIMCLIAWMIRSREPQRSLFIRKMRRTGAKLWRKSWRACRRSEGLVAIRVGRVLGGAEGTMYRAP